MGSSDPVLVGFGITPEGALMKGFVALSRILSPVDWSVPVFVGLGGAAEGIPDESFVILSKRLPAAGGGPDAFVGVVCDGLVD